MAEHKFKIGQMVDVRASLFGATPPGPYEVTRQLPPTGVSNQYRVKSHKSGQERVVREDDIYRNDDALAEVAVIEQTRPTKTAQRRPR